MSTRLFIVRHAEHVTPVDDHLSSAGSLQAAALAETFKSSGTKFDAIYASSRCKETADVIAKALDLDVTIDERLRNLNGGMIQGLSKDEVRIKHPEVYEPRYVHRDPDYVLPHGESLKQRYTRVEQFLQDVVATGPSPQAEPRQLIIVTHGGVIDDIYRIACKLPLPEKTNLKKPFGCVSALLHENGNWRDEQWVRADHLPRVVAESPSGGHLYLFPNQVSGSFPMLRGDRGELCKPATPNELSCYTAIFADPPISYEISRLKECVPKLLGTVDVDIASFIQETPVGPNSPQDQHIMDAGSLAGSGLLSLASHGDDDTRKSVETIDEVITSTSSDREEFKIKPRKSFSVSGLWSRFVKDRWHKLVRQSEANTRCVYLVLEDVTYKQLNPNIMDVKVGTRQHRDTETEEKKARKEARCVASTSASHGLRVHGITMFPRNKFGKMVRIDKYEGRKLQVNGLFDSLKDFVDAPTADPRLVVARVVARLETIRECVKGVTWRFYGSSILIVFDSKVKDPVVHVRLIDMGSCDMNPQGTSYDEGLVLGLTNLIRGFREGLLRIGSEKGEDWSTAIPPPSPEDLDSSSVNVTLVSDSTLSGPMTRKTGLSETKSE